MSKIKTPALPLDEWVFTTEAHPLHVWREAE